jgi:hypothetical protein
MVTFKETVKALMRPKPVGVTFLCMATALALMLATDRHLADFQGDSGHMRLVPLLHLHLQPMDHQQLDVLELKMGLNVKTSMNIQLGLRQLLLM